MDVALGESDWKRAASGVAQVKSGGLSASALEDIFWGTGWGLAAVVPLPFDAVQAARAGSRLIRGASKAETAVGAAARAFKLSDTDATLLDDALSAAVERGRSAGFTMDPRTSNLDNWRGYGVSVVPGAERQFDPATFSRADLDQFILDNIDALRKDPDLMVGGWLDNASDPVTRVKVPDRQAVYLDLTKVYADPEDALRAGAMFNQLAVTDFGRLARGAEGAFIDVPRSATAGSLEAVENAIRAGLYGDRPVADMDGWREMVESERVARLNELSLEIARSELPRSNVGPDAFREIRSEEVRRMASAIAGRMADRPFANVTRDELANILMDSEDFRFWFEYEAIQTAGSKSEARLLTEEDLSDAAQTINKNLPESKRLRIPQGAKLDNLEAGKKAPLERFQKATTQAEKDAAYRDFALNVADEMRNMSAFLTDTIFNPKFYKRYAKILRSVEKRTGVNRLALNAALGVASAQASPIEEIIRLEKVIPFMKVRGDEAGRVVYFDSEAAIAAGVITDKQSDFIRATGEAFAASLNNPDFITNEVSGIGAKVQAYIVSREAGAGADTVYVADTVDGSSKNPTRKIEGISKTGKEKEFANATDTTSVANFRLNQFVGRLFSEIYSVPPQAMQEAVWAFTRILREGMGSRSWIGAAFSRNGVKMDKLLVDALAGLPDEITSIGQANYNAFRGKVASGEIRHWAITPRGDVYIRPDSITEAAIPPDQRGILMNSRDKKTNVFKARSVAEDYLGRELFMNSKNVVSQEVMQRAITNMAPSIRGAVMLGITPFMLAIPFFPEYAEDDANLQDWV